MAPNQTDSVSVPDDAATSEAPKTAATALNDNKDKSPSVESKSTSEQPQCTPQKAESEESSTSGGNGAAKIKDASEPNAEEKKDASGDEPADGTKTNESESTANKDEETTKKDDKSDKISKDETIDDDDGKTQCGKRKDHPSSNEKNDNDDSKDGEPQKKAKLFSFSSVGSTFGSTAFKFPSPATTTPSAFSFSSNSQFTFGKAANSSSSNTGSQSIFGTSSNTSNTFANAAASSTTPFSSTKSDHPSNSSTNNNPFSSTAADPAAQPAKKPILPPPTSAPPRNGEEDETVRHQTRAKLYTGCPPTSNWKEVGIGPLRILTNKKNNITRIVQRRESTPHGPGTKLILNVAVTGSCNNVDRQAEKYVRLATTGEKGEVVMYLFRFSSVEAADELERKLGEVLRESGGGGEEEEER